MWLFNLFKRKKISNTDLSKQLVDYLNKVDAEYMRAYAVKSTRILQMYISRECAMKVTSTIFGINSRYFGSSKLRHTTWIKVSQDTKVLKILKNVVFDKIYVGGAMSIEAADNYKEYWLVDISDEDKPIIIDISKATL